MKLNNKLRRDNGITLVALVVTIIVLIILAGVSISLVLGENGIITKARQAKEETLNAQVEEQEKLNEIVDYIENYGVTTPTDDGIVEGTLEDWSVVENGDGTGTISYFKGTIPEDGTLVIPNVVDGVKITKIEMSYDDVRALGGHNGAGSLPILFNSQNYSSTSMYNSTIKKIIVSEGITTIGSCAFAITSVETVELPTSVTQIDREAFRECSKLTNINIPSGMTSIGNHAFNYCTKLTSVTIPCSMNINIGQYAFANCTNMAHVYFEGIMAPVFGSKCFYKSSGTITTYYFRSNAVSRSFSFDTHYNESLSRAVQGDNW